VLLRTCLIRVVAMAAAVVVSAGPIRIGAQVVAPRRKRAPAPGSGFGGGGQGCSTFAVAIPYPVNEWRLRQEHVKPKMLALCRGSCRCGEITPGWSANLTLGLFQGSP
jgi:hypothetical protein